LTLRPPVDQIMHVSIPHCVYRTNKPPNIRFRSHYSANHLAANHRRDAGVRCIMRYLALLFLLLTASTQAQQKAPVHEGIGTAPQATLAANRFGLVKFATSCNPSVAVRFNNAVAILHSFEYDEARAAFEDVGHADPTCAMAKWGEAMSYFHGLWGEYNAAEGAKAVAEAKRRAAENAQTTLRERDYIAAISAIFSDEEVSGTERKNSHSDPSGYSHPSLDAERRYTRRMAKLHDEFPDDREATIFFALALDISAQRSDKSHADLRHCTALLYPLFNEMPNHPGVAHYIIHCNDNPEMAKEGLEAARKYAQIAPASAHATHMPSHIFSQLGLWDEMAESNRVSLRAAEDDVKASPCEKVGNTLHSMSYLVLALSETGQMEEARRILERARSVKASVPGAELCYDDANQVLAGYLIETGDWSWARYIRVQDDKGPLVNSLLWLAIGMASAHTGDDAQANDAEQHLVTLRDLKTKTVGETSENSMEVLRLAVAGWRAQRAGQKAQAIQDLRAASDLQDRLGTSYVTIKPIREMLADILLLSGDPKQAIVEYKAVLDQKANRFDSLYGAGTSAFALGDIPDTKMYYQQLLTMASGSERPELVNARKKMEQIAQSETK
jgi:tetratricopeptide (TPR) repeat protein